MIMLMGYRLEHLAILRSYSKKFNIPFISLDIGIDQFSDIVQLSKFEPVTDIISDDEDSVEAKASTPISVEPNDLDLILNGDYNAETPSDNEVRFGIPYVNAVYLAMLKRGWRRFFAIYDSEDGLRRLHGIFKRMAVNEQVIDVKLRRVSLGDEFAVANELLHYHRMSSNVLLDIRNESTLAALLKGFKDTDLFNDQIDYLVSGLVRFNYNFANIR